MTGIPKLCYFNGRGKMESIRWLLAAAGVEFEEEFLETREQFEKLLQGPSKMLMCTIKPWHAEGELLIFKAKSDETKWSPALSTSALGGNRWDEDGADQSHSQLLAAKYNLYGKDLKERALIDMYVEGTTDLMGLILMCPFLSAKEKEKQHTIIIQKATNRYFPVYEKVLKDHRQNFLVGNQFSWADVHLLEAILMVEEKNSSVLSEFPQLQAFKARISNIPTIKKFLEPGSQRKPVPDDKYVETVRRVLQMHF